MPVDHDSDTKQGVANPRGTRGPKPTPVHLEEREVRQPAAVPGVVRAPVGAIGAEPDSLSC